jgi:hypothetical protein
MLTVTEDPRIGWVRAELDHLRAQHARLLGDSNSDPFELLALELRCQALEKRIEVAVRGASPCPRATHIPRTPFNWSVVVSGG